MSQSAKILSDLKAGMILTPMKALTRHRCMRLAARIGELRKTYPIQSRIIHKRGKKFAAYWL